MGWVARNIFNNDYYGIEYDSIYDCQKYINEELNLDYIWNEYFNRNDIRCQFQKYCLKYKMGNIVKCYNTEQLRFCTSFDF